MKLKKSLIASLCAAALLGMSAGGLGATILFQFNPTGGGLGAGLINGGALLDEAPGNDLGIGGVFGLGLPLPVGTVVQDLYQANLSVLKGATNNILFTNGGTGTQFFTFVAGFSEIVVGSGILGSTVTNNFALVPGGFFKICAQSAAGVDLSGLGFSCAGDGILSGQVISGNATQTGVLTGLGPLDGFVNNDYPGVTTVTSSGGANLTLKVNTVNAGYFPNLLIGGFITTSFTNTSNITPFNQADPSAVFSANGIANGGTASNIGAINGISGPNFQFQADANSSFDRTVPEPGTLALLGVALAGMSGFLRRGRKVN